MKFYTFGSRDKEIVILIHGMLTPWQIWQAQIDNFKERYFVIVPALDGHIEDEKTEFVSIRDEAEKIEKYIRENYGGKIFAVCGLSMGGAIANILFSSKRLQIKYLILDGAPLVPTGGFSKKLMTDRYITLVHKSQKRDAKTLASFKRDFLPEKYLDSYLKFVDTMSDRTIENMVASVCESQLCISDNEHKTKILYMHGTKGNESLSKKSAKLVKKYYPEARITPFSGYGHAELAVYKPEEWINAFVGFVNSF